MKPILTGMSPNVQPDDIRLAAKILVQPQKWFTGQAVNRLNKQLQARFKARAGFGFSSGRAGLWAALQALQLKPGDQVLLQAFCCIVVPNAIKAAGGQPVFIDTQKDSVNMSITDLRSKISSKTRAIIVQHLFGYPDNLVEIKKICREHQLILIEDVAQSLGADYQDKPVGSWGDIAMFSFGRDKIISSVNGGFLTINQAKFKSRLDKIYKNLVNPNPGLVVKSLIHPLVFSLVKPVYFCCRLNRFSLGKAILFIAQKLDLVKRPVSLIELSGQMVQPKKLANGLALLALNQLGKLDKSLLKRRQHALDYIKTLKDLPIKIIQANQAANPVYLRLPILVSQPDKLFQLAYSRKIYLGRWYQSVIGPQGANLGAVNYKSGSCPQAEALVARIINLPTYPSLSNDQIEAVIELIKDYCELYEN